MSREATHLSVVNLPPDPVYSNSTLSAKVRVLNGDSPAHLQTTRSVSVRELRRHRISGDTSQSDPQPTFVAASAKAFSAEVDKNIGVAAIDLQLSTSCVEAELVFEAGFLRSAISRTVVVHPGHANSYFDKAPPPNSRVEILSIKPVSGKHIIVGQPVVVKLQLVDCIGSRLINLDLKHTTATVSSPMTHVLLRYERITNAGSDHVLTIPDLVIDTPGKLKLNFALSHAAFPEVGNASVDLDVYQGQWWRDDVWKTLEDLGGSSVVMLDDRVLIFGGIGSLGSLNRLAEYVPRLNTISLVLPSSAFVPTARFNHAACAQNGTMWIYGGASTPGSSEPLGGLYRYLHADRVWEDWNDVEGQPSGIMSPKLLANSSALILFDARSQSSILLHILSTVRHENSKWSTVPAPENMQPVTSLDAVVAMHPQGSAIAILSNTTLMVYALASDTWSHVRIAAAPGSSSSVSVFFSCLWLGDRLLLLQRSAAQVLQVSALQVTIQADISLPMSNATTGHAQQTDAGLEARSLSASWLQTVDVTPAPAVKSESVFSLVSLSASQMLIIGGPVSAPFRTSDTLVSRLSLEAAVALRLVPTKLPDIASAGALLEPQVQVVDEAGRLVVGGQRGRRIEVTGTVNGTGYLTGSLYAPVVRGIARFTSLSLMHLSSGVVLSFAESFGVFEDAVSAHAIQVLPGDPARLQVVQVPQGLYVATPFLAPLRVQLRDRFDNIVYDDFWTRVRLGIEVWSTDDQSWVDSPLLSGQLDRVVSAGQAEFEGVAIKSDPGVHFRLVVRSFGVPVTAIAGLSMSNYTDSELVITGLQKATYTSGRIGDVGIMRVARLAPGTRAYPLTGDNTSMVSVNLLPAALLGPVADWILSNQIETSYEEFYAHHRAQVREGRACLDRWCNSLCAEDCVQKNDTVCLYECFLQYPSTKDPLVFGSRTLQLAQGSAVFTDLSVFRAGRGYVLEFSDSANSGEASCTMVGGTSCVSFDIIPGAPSVLSMHSEAIAAYGGSAFAEQPVASLTDAAGNLVLDETEARLVVATAALSSGPAHVGTLHGRTRIVTQGGQARFSDLALDLAASFKLTFSSQNLTNASLALKVSAGAPASLFLVQQPGNGSATVAFAQQPIVGFMDKGGNVAKRHSGASVTVYGWLERTWPPVRLELKAVSSSLAVLRSARATGVVASPHVTVSGLVQWSMQAYVDGQSEGMRAQFLAVACRQSSRASKSSVLVDSSIFQVQDGTLGRVGRLSTHGLVGLAHFQAKDSKGVEGEYLAVAMTSFGARILDNSTRDFAQGYQGQIPKTSGDYVTRLCTSTAAAGPACEATFSEIPVACTGFSLTIAVINTDFNGVDEFVSAVYIGDRKVGGPFQLSAGKDSECSVKTVIVPALDLAPDSFSAEGEATVRIETSNSVGSFMCNGATLLVEVTIAWSTTAIYRIQPQPAPASEMELVHVQSLQGFAPRTLTAFSIGQDAFLAVAVEGDANMPAQSPTFKWNSAKSTFQLCSSIETHRATSVEHFRIGSQDFIAVANSFNFTTVSSNSSNAVYEWDGETFRHRWDLFSLGASELIFFHMSSTPYLLIAPTDGSGDREGATAQGDALLLGYDTKLDGFVHVQLLHLPGVSWITSFERGGLTWIVAATYATPRLPASLHILIEACGKPGLSAGTNTSACLPSVQLALSQVRKCCDENLDARYGADRTLESRRRLRQVQSMAHESQAGLVSLSQFGLDPHYVVTASISGKISVHTLFAEDTLHGALVARSNDTQVPFTDLTVQKRAEYVLRFSSNLLQGVASDPFEIVSGPGYKLYVARTVSGAFGGSPFDVQPVIHVHDRADNLVSNLNFSVTASLWQQTEISFEEFVVIHLAEFNSGRACRWCNSTCVEDCIQTNDSVCMYECFRLHPWRNQPLLSIKNAEVSFEEFYALHLAGVRDGRLCRDRWCNSLCAEDCVEKNDTVCMYECFLQYPSCRDPLAPLESNEQQNSNQSNVTSALITAHGVHGVAEFKNLGVRRAGLNFSLEISAPGLLSVTTQLFSVLPGAPYSFEISRHPSDATAGKPFLRQPQLVLLDRGENRVDASQRAVAWVKVRNNPRGVMSLSGTTELVFSGPLATFTDLAIGLLSRDYTVEFQVWALDSNATYDPALPALCDLVSGASVSAHFEVSGGDAEVLSVETALLAEGSIGVEWLDAVVDENGAAIEGASARLTLLRSHLFADALVGMDLKLFNHRNRMVFTTPIRLQSWAHERDAVTQDVSVNITSASDLKCLNESWWASSNLTYRVYSHAGRDALILSGSSFHNAADGKYHVENYDDLGLPIYEQQLAESIFLDGASTCQEAACENVSHVVSTMSGVYVKLEVEHHGYPVYRQGSRVLYRTTSSVEPVWRLFTLEHAVQTFLVNVFSASVSEWGGSHRLSFQASSQEWVVHRVPLGVMTGFANDTLEQGVGEGSDASSGAGSRDSGCYLCEQKTAIRKHQGHFWFVVEKGSFAQVGARCAAYGGDMASILSLADAQVARLVCPSDACHIGVAANLSASSVSFWWSDENWVGQGTDSLPGVCVVKEMSDCAQCGAIVLRASSRDDQLPDRVHLWQERNGSQFLNNSRLLMYRAPIAEVQDAGGNLVQNNHTVSEVAISLLSQHPVPEPRQALGVGALALTSISLSHEERLEERLVERLVVLPTPAQRVCNQTSCPLDFDTTPVLYSWRWPHAGHTIAHIANGNFFFKNHSREGATRPRTLDPCPMHWECSGKVSHLPVFPNPSHFTFETFQDLYFRNHTQACDETSSVASCSSSVDLCVEACVRRNNTRCAYECYNEGKLEAIFDTFPSAESLFASDGFGADVPTHAGVQCSVGGSLVQYVLHGALAGDIITWEISAAQLIQEPSHAALMDAATFEIRLGGELVLGPVTPPPVPGARSQQYQWQFVVPDTYDFTRNPGIELWIQVFSDSPFPQEPLPSIVFGALKVVNHVSDAAFESLELLQPPSTHNSRVLAVQNTQLLGTYARTDVVYNGHPVYCRRSLSADSWASSDNAAPSNGSGESGSAESGAGENSTDAARHVANVDTAYLVYSQGLWVVTTGNSPRSLASSPLLLAWGTSDFIAGEWRELTPYRPSSAGDSIGEIWGQGDSAVPLDLWLHAIAHLPSDQFPTADQGLGNQLPWAVSTLSSLAVRPTWPSLEEHSLLSHAGTLVCMRACSACIPIIAHSRAICMPVSIFATCVMSFARGYQFVHACSCMSACCSRIFQELESRAASSCS